jgi:hypothetical protein
VRILLDEQLPRQLARHIQGHQVLVGSPIGVAVLAARGNALEDLIPLVASLQIAMRNAVPGEVRRVEGS